MAEPRRGQSHDELNDTVREQAYAAVAYRQSRGCIGVFVRCFAQTSNRLIDVGRREAAWSKVFLRPGAALSA